MVSAMQNEEDQDQDHSKRITVALDSFKDKNLEDFVTSKSMTLLRMMELPDGFLTVDPDLWEDRDDYKQAAEIVKSLKVVNDHTERGVALIQEYSGLLTRDETQLQFLLQVVEDHRRMYPDSRKQTMSGPGPTPTWKQKKSCWTLPDWYTVTSPNNVFKNKYYEMFKKN